MLILGKINKAISQHWFAKEALEDLGSPTRLLQRFYQDAVTEESGSSEDQENFPEARCVAGVAADSKRVLSSVYHVKILDYSANIRCQGL